MPRVSVRSTFDEGSFIVIEETNGPVGIRHGSDSPYESSEWVAEVPDDVWLEYLYAKEQFEACEQTILNLRPEK